MAGINNLVLASGFNLWGEQVVIVAEQFTELALDVSFQCLDSLSHVGISLNVFVVALFLSQTDFVTLPLQTTEFFHDDGLFVLALMVHLLLGGGCLIAHMPVLHVFGVEAIEILGIRF